MHEYHTHKNKITIDYFFSCLNPCSTCTVYCTLYNSSPFYTNFKYPPKCYLHFFVESSTESASTHMCLIFLTCTIYFVHVCKYQYVTSRKAQYVRPFDISPNWFGNQQSLCHRPQKIQSTHREAMRIDLDENRFTFNLKNWLFSDHIHFNSYSEQNIVSLALAHTSFKQHLTNNSSWFVLQCILIENCTIFTKF